MEKTRQTLETEPWDVKKVAACASPEHVSSGSVGEDT